MATSRSAGQTPKSSRQSPARRNGEGAVIDSAAASEAIVRFAGDRANELVDWLHQRLKDEIVNAQTSFGETGLPNTLHGTTQFLRAAGRYAAQHPWRAGMLLALVGTAVVMAVPPESEVVTEH